MITKMSINFNEIEIEGFLQKAIPVRFHDTDPHEFEQFIGYLFEQNGYTLEQTIYRLIALHQNNANISRVLGNYRFPVSRRIAASILLTL